MWAPLSRLAGFEFVEHSPDAIDFAALDDLERGRAVEGRVWRFEPTFWQHILCGLTHKNGRCAILFPHGVLFRQEEAEMRRKLIEADLIECVLGLGPNRFYNSPMEACVVICRTAKRKARKGKILFIDGVNEVTRARAQSFLTDDHIECIVKAYEQFKDEPGFTRVRAAFDGLVGNARLTPVPNATKNSIK